MGYTICFESFFFLKKTFWEKVDKEKNKMKTVVCVCVCVCVCEIKKTLCF